MSRILLTNDDGVDSPALVPFARALQDAGHDVTVTVPEGERSWIGKAVTRHAPVTLAVVSRGGLQIHTTSGTPADAVQLGIHQVAAGDVDLVVAGINLGFNHGAAFLLSSGTIGAAVEGWICRRPAIAFSTGAWGADWGSWRRHVDRREAAAEWTAMAGRGTHLLTRILDTGLTGLADIVSVNVPYGVDRAPWRVTDVARVGYGGVFCPDGPGRWRHAQVRLDAFDTLTGTDVEGAADGAVTITLVRMPVAPSIPDEMRARLERQ